MSRLTRDGTAKPVSQDQIIWRKREQGNIHIPCPAYHEQGWQPYPVDPYSAMSHDHRHIHKEYLLGAISGNFRQCKNPCVCGGGGVAVYASLDPLPRVDSFSVA